MRCSSHRFPLPQQYPEAVPGAGTLYDHDYDGAECVPRSVVPIRTRSLLQLTHRRARTHHAPAHQLR